MITQVAARGLGVRRSSDPRNLRRVKHGI